MKGFIFTIEAVAALLVVFAVMGVFFFSSAGYTPRTTALEIQAQSAQASTLYFNLNGQPGNSAALEQNCGTINYYDVSSGQDKISQKILCRWVNAR